MNVLNKQKQEEILTLIIAGHSFRKIAKRLHVGRSTVSEYAKAHRVIAKKGRTGNGIRFCRRFFHIFLTPSNILS